MHILPDKLSHLSIWRGEIEIFTPAPKLGIWNTPLFSDKQIWDCVFTALRLPYVQRDVTGKHGFQWRKLWWRLRPAIKATIIIISMYTYNWVVRYTVRFEIFKLDIFYNSVSCSSPSLTWASPLVSSSCSTSSSSSSTSTSWSVRASTSWCWSSCGRKTPPLRWVDEDIRGLYGMLGEDKSQFFIQNRKRIHSKYRFISLPWVHYYLAKPIPHIWEDTGIQGI